jgi:flagellar motor switch protein FliG
MSDNQPSGTLQGRASPQGGQVVTRENPGEERAALLLKILPGELAEAVLGRMVPENASRLRERMNAAPAAGSPQALQVLRGFVERVRRSLAVPSGTPTDEFVGSPLAKAMLHAIDTAPVSPSRTLSSDSPEAKADAGTDDSPDQEPGGDPVRELRELGAARMAAVLRNERTPAVVVTLSCLTTADASDVLKRLPPERRREATLRLARGTPAADLQRAVARAVVRRGKALGNDPAALEGDGTARKLAELLRGLERDDRKEVLEVLTRDDLATAEKVKALLYVFEDLLRIEDRSVQALLAEVEMKTLAQAMSGADEVMMTKVMNNLSQRARDTLTEEMGLLGKPRMTHVNEARNRVVVVIQRLDAEGKLVMME